MCVFAHLLFLSCLSLVELSMTLFPLQGLYIENLHLGVTPIKSHHSPTPPDGLQLPTPLLFPQMPPAPLLTRSFLCCSPLAKPLSWPPLLVEYEPLYLEVLQCGVKHKVRQQPS